jgi:hypothetical protein
MAFADTFRQTILVVVVRVESAPAALYGDH